jgi:hypothetical protein
LTRLKLRTAAVGLFAILTPGATLLATSGAQAATMSGATAPAQAATTQTVSAAATCDPKLDFEDLAGDWSNICGDVTFAFGGDTGPGLAAIRMPTTPYHRVWLHQDTTGGGLTACFYSEDTDVYMANYTSKYGTWIEHPGNIQVSANTSPC